MSDEVRLTATPEVVHLVPGDQWVVSLAIQNAGSDVAHYRLDVNGIPADWYDLESATVRLPPASTVHVPLIVHLPATLAALPDSYPITVEASSLDNPTVHVSAAIAFSAGSGADADQDIGAGSDDLDIAVLPTMAEGRDATFSVACLNQSPAPITVELTAYDSASALRVCITAEDPLVVPAATAAVLATVHVAPKDPKAIRAPHSYDIEFRVRRHVQAHASNPNLVRRTHFTYVPRYGLPRLPEPLRGAPAWLLLIPLALLLLAFAGDHTLAALTARKSAAAPTAAAIAPPGIGLFALRRSQGTLYVTWLVRNAVHVQLQGGLVPSRGERAVPPDASTLSLIADNSGGRQRRTLVVPRPSATPSARPTPTRPPTATRTPRPTRTPMSRPTATRMAKRTSSGTAAPIRGTTPMPRSHGIPTVVATLSRPFVLLNPLAVHFARQALHSSSAIQTIYVVNLAPHALVITSVTIGGAHPADFSEHDSCMHRTIRVDNGCAIDVVFSPRSSGFRSATVFITDNGEHSVTGEHSPQAVRLSGQG